MLKKRHGKVLIVLLAIVLGSKVLAANPVAAAAEAARSTANPARVQQDLTPPPIPQATAQPSPQTPTTAKLAIPEAFKKIKFTLHKIVIVGAKHYKPAELAPLYQKYIGKNISLADLFSIAQAITNKYQKDGFILSQAIIPAQKIKKNGVVTIQVIEGYIKNVKVQGDARYAEYMLYRFGKHLSRERPLNAKTLERFSLLANDLPGLKVHTVITPSPTTTGAADLTFLVTQSNFQANVSYNNRGTLFLGPDQISSQLIVNNIVGSSDSSLQGLATPDFRELTFVQFSHEQVVGDNGTRFSLLGSVTKTNPGFTLKPFNLKGESDYYQGKLSFPVIRTRRENLTFAIQADATDSNSNFALFSLSNNIGLYHDKITSIRLLANYERTDKWRGINGLNLGASKGVNVLGAPFVDPIIPTSRPNGKPTYGKFTALLSRLQYLPYNLSILASVNTQYALDPLLAPEQLGYGGIFYGRAYDPSEILGDSGVEGSLELRWNPAFSFPLLRSAQYYVFWDIGKIWNRDTLTQVDSASGASAGFGTRCTFAYWLDGGLEFAKPLTRNVATLGNDRNARVFFYLSANLDK